MPGRTGLVAAVATVAVLSLALVGLGPGRGQPGPVSDAPMTPWPAGDTPAHIVTFGTSLTAGNGWPDRLAESLTRCFGHRVTVTRVAAPGAGSAWGVEALPRVVAQAPDVVLVEFAINDADWRDGVRPDVARAQHAAIFEGLRQRLPQARIVAMTMSPAYGLRGWLRPRLAHHYRQVVALATARGLGVIDFYPRWLRLDDRPLFPDGLHPTDAATRRVVDPVLTQAFATATGRRC